MKLMLTRPAPVDTSRAHVFYYDGGCGLCVASMRLLRVLDVTRRVRWVRHQALDRPPAGLSWTDLERAAYLESPDARLDAGFHALQRLTTLLPLLSPIAPLLRLPCVDRLGEAVYGAIARRRRRFCNAGARSPRRGTPA